MPWNAQDVVRVPWKVLAPGRVPRCGPIGGAPTRLNRWQICGKGMRGSGKGRRGRAGCGEAPEGPEGRAEGPGGRGFGPHRACHGRCSRST